MKPTPKKTVTRRGRQAVNPENRNPVQDRLYQKILECRGVTPERPNGYHSEKAFGKLIGFSYQTLQNVRKGAFTPSDDLIMAVARYAGLDQNQFLDYVHYGKEMSIDPVDQTLNHLRLMFAPDLIKALDTIAMRWKTLEEVNHPPNRI